MRLDGRGIGLGRGFVGLARPCVLLAGEVDVAEIGEDPCGLRREHGSLCELALRQIEVPGPARNR